MPNDEIQPRNGATSGRRMVTIMSKEERINGKKTKWEELEITGIVKNISPHIWSLTHLTSLYLNNNQLSRIPPEIAKLNKLYRLDLSSNKLRSLPAEIGHLINLRELMLNNNILRVLPYEIGKLFNLHILGLSGNPLNQDLLSLMKSGTPRLLTYLLDNLVVTTPTPPDRDWIFTAHPKPAPHNAVFTVMSYNVLCDKYATRQLYGYCPPWALQWDYRKKKILDEIMFYNADILALQEVETCEYHNSFVKSLGELGYQGIFNPKSRAKHMAEEDKKHVDGCAIFWKSSKFQLRTEHLIEFNQVAMANNEGSQEMLNRVMTKDNIGIAALLETKDQLYDDTQGYRDPPRQLVLAVNAHMHWDPEFSDVKLLQTVMLCYELKRICEESSKGFNNGRASMQQLGNESHKIPLVLCGDFNSLPESGVVEFLQSGKVSPTHTDFRDLHYHKSLNIFGNGLRTNGSVQNSDSKIVTHPFKFDSSYSNYIPQLRYTNITHEFKGIIDYIFYSRTQLNCLGILAGVDQQWIEENKVVGFPHPHIPSDHIPLVSEFQLLAPPSYHNNNASNNQSSVGGGGQTTAVSSNNAPPANMINNSSGYHHHHQQHFNNHHFSRYFNTTNQSSGGGGGGGVYPSNGATGLPPNGLQQQQSNNPPPPQQQQQQQRQYQPAPSSTGGGGGGGSRPGSANMLTSHSPINLPHGGGPTSKPMPPPHMAGGMGGMNMGARR